MQAAPVAERFDLWRVVTNSGTAELLGDLEGFGSYDDGTLLGVG